MRLCKPVVERGRQAKSAVYAYEAYTAAPDNTSTSSVNNLPSQEDDKLSSIHKEAVSNVVSDMLTVAGATAVSTRNLRAIAATTLIVGTRSVQTNCLNCHNGN